MLTRRENLFIRPWQERRYIQHRLKVFYSSFYYVQVQSALPAIDNSSPPIREHVCFKLKKVQKESERCSQIISDNFTLLQHLSRIMSTTRVDHFWEEPPTNFLQRVGIYPTAEQSAICREEPIELPAPKNRREKCEGCSPERYKPKEMFDVRRPYTPPKERLSKKPEPLPDWESQFKSRCAEDRLEFRGKVWNKPQEQKAPIKKKKKSQRYLKRTSSENAKASEPEVGAKPPSIEISKGGLNVAVKFPAQSEVVFCSSVETEVVQQKLCECQSFPRIRKKRSKKPTGGKRPAVTSSE